jgi:uncharacterized iron-regulated membrane protein
MPSFPNIRKLFFWCHLAVGVAFGALIFVKAITGICLVFEGPLEKWAERAQRVVEPPAPNAPHLTFADIVGRAQAANAAREPNGITIKSDPTASVAVNFGRDGGNLYVDPYTGEVLGGDSEVHKAMEWIEGVHRWFGFRNAGKPVSGAATIGFFLLALSGLYLWRPATWTRLKVKSITVFNPALSGKARDWNRHNVIGFWLAPFLLVITSTGLIMSYAWANNLLYRATGNEPPPIQRDGAMRSIHKGDDRIAQLEERPMLSVDELLKKVKQKVPSWVSISVRFPQKPGGPVTTQIVESEPSIGLAVRSQATLDAQTGDLEKWEPFSAVNAGRKARIWARYLHTGEAGGAVGQFLALLSAAGASLLVWTGFSMTWRRWRS